MSTIIMNKKDELIMKLVHYFITEENYNPIIVNGVKDEIWLENSEGPYHIVRINSNNIFNKEQLKFDNYKIENIVKQIKKKTFSFNVNTLSILLDVNEDLEIEKTKNINPVALSNDCLKITNVDILEAFPDINEKMLNESKGIDLIVNVTKDINEKTEKDNRLYDKVFRPKKILVTPILIALCVIMFLVTVILAGSKAFADSDIYTLLLLGGNLRSLIQAGQVWRLVSYMFLHASLIHLLVNMYSLNIIGTQIENYLGKTKYLIVYIVSGICGGLFSVCINSNIVSVGASGAIFGLMGALLYFGYHYRNYLGNVVKTQILPIVAINLGIGFLVSGIDNACHIGGFVGGLLSAMALGLEGKTKRSEQISGIICLIALIGALSYMLIVK